MPTMELTEEEVKTIQAARGAAPTADEKRVLIGFAIDASGSMNDCVSDTIGGHNRYLEDQAKEPGACLFSRILFTTALSAPPTELAPIATASRLDEKNYVPAGGTPLWDGVGRMIEHLTAGQKAEDAVILVVITDGAENSSREYDKTKIRKMVAEREATGKWTVVFLGADFDASAEGGAVGVGASNTMDYAKERTISAYAGVSGATKGLRRSHLAGEASMAGNFGDTARDLMNVELAENQG